MGLRMNLVLAKLRLKATTTWTPDRQRTRPESTVSYQIGKIPHSVPAKALTTQRSILTNGAHIIIHLSQIKASYSTPEKVRAYL